MLEAFQTRSNLRQVDVGGYCIVVEQSGADEDKRAWRYVLYKGKPNLYYTNMIAGSSFVYPEPVAAFDAAQARIAALDEPQYRREDWFETETSGSGPQHSRMVQELAKMQTQAKSLASAIETQTDQPSERDGVPPPYYGKDYTITVCRYDDGSWGWLLYEPDKDVLQTQPLERGVLRFHNPWIAHNAGIDAAERSIAVGRPLSKQSDTQKVGVRQGWDQFFMGLAAYYASQASCNSKVGAVIVDADTHAILGAGFNGAPQGATHCIEAGCQVVSHHSRPDDTMCIRCIHAEVNALMDAISKGMERYSHDPVLYTTRQPCHECLKLLIQWHVYNIVYRDPYEDTRITRELARRVSQRQLV